MAHFIGKTISLISNSDIRYVGVLHEINSKESTVSLRNVRCYGTEGRRGGTNELPASENIYEFIVFRGSDVKDLSISDPVPAPPPLVDPAITSQRPAQQTFASQNAYASSSWNAPAPILQQPPASSTSSFTGSLTSSTPISASATGSSLTATSAPSDKTSSAFSFASTKSPATPVPSATPTQTTSAFTSSTPVSASQPSETKLEETTQPKEEESAEEKAPGNEQSVSTPVESQQPQLQQQNQQQQLQQQSQEQPSTTQSQQNQQYPSTSRQSFPPRRIPTGPVAAGSTEFNFAEMNAKFSKEEVAKEISGNQPSSVIPVEAKSSFYDKKTSFFDNISSTTKERLEGNEEPRRRGDERRLNMETFGQEYVYRGGNNGNRNGYRGNRSNNTGNRNGGYRGNRNNGGNGGYNNSNTGGYGSNGGYRNGSNSGNYYGNGGFNNNNRRGASGSQQPSNNFGPAPEI